MPPSSMAILLLHAVYTTALFKRRQRPRPFASRQSFSPPYYAAADILFDISEFVFTPPRRLSRLMPRAYAACRAPRRRTTR